MTTAAAGATKESLSAGIEAAQKIVGTMVDAGADAARRIEGAMRGFANSANRSRSRSR